jgi:hypothetical protein
MIMSVRFPRNRARRGSALALAILVSVVLTGLVMALAFEASVHAAMGGQIPKIDAAYYAAEAGAQQAVWKFKHDNTWRATSASPLTGTLSMYNTDWTYSVTCTDQVGDANLAWKFDEAAGTTTADSSGSGNTGTFHGGVSWYTPGRSGACIQLNGVDGYVDCGNSASTNLTGDMSFSVWVKMNSGYYDQKIGGNQNGTFGGYKLCIYNSKAEFEVRDSGNNPHLNRDVGGGTVLVMGTWYHILGVYSESGHWIKTYVNGKLDRYLQGDGTGTGKNDVPTNALGSTTGNFVMGKEPWSSLYYFNGYMDDIRIWKRALSDANARQLFDTTVEIHSNVTGGMVSNQANYFASIPTPPPPSTPAMTIGGDMSLKNIQVNGDLSIAGNVSCTSGSTTVGGNLYYTGSLNADSHLTVQGTTAKVGSVSQPTVNFTDLHNQASNWGQVVTGDSTGQTFSFNSLGGNKVIWIKGNLKDPVVTIGGTYAAGGTFVVDGTVTFSGGSTTIGAAGYPVNFVSAGDISQTGGSLALIGSLFTTGNFAHKNCSIDGLVWAKSIINNASATCTFTTAPSPWFDNRAVSQPPTLPLYTSNHTGLGP